MHLLPEFGFLLRRVGTIVHCLTVLANVWIHLGMFAIDDVDGLTLAPVYWNASNPMFKPSINNPVIEVQLRDEIDFVCPWDASNGTDGGSTAAEYYAIYQVSQTEYDSCKLFTGNRNPLLIVNCSAPDAKRRFTVIFEPYQSIPNVPEYKLGMTYYYTTTSTGKRDGITNSINGACHDFNMKLAFYVCCPTTTNPGSSSTNLTSTTTTTSQSSTVRMAQSSLASTSNKVNKPTDSISQLLSPSMSSTAKSITRRPRTSTTTSTVKSTTPKYPNSDTSTTSTFVKRTGDISTTKITQLPQPSYQQTVSGCRQTSLSPTLVTILTLTLGRLLYHSLT